MITIVLQCLDAALTLVFGVVAGRVQHRVRPRDPLRADGWKVVGWGFVIVGVSSVVQTTAAAGAWALGPESELYQGYLRFLPVGNQGRNAVALALGLLLLGLVLAPRRRARLARSAAPTLGLALAVGSLLGWMEGPFDNAAHLSLLAVLDLVAMLLFFAVLLGAAARHTLDRLLWAALCVYALRQGLAVIWRAGISWYGVEGAWSPSPAQWQGVSAALWAVTVAAGYARLRLARQNRPVPGLLEPLDRPISASGITRP